MKEELEQAKVSLKNVNDIADIKRNPVVESVLMPVIKSVPIIGDMIDSSMDKIVEDFQKKKEKEFVEVVLKDSHSITSEMVNDVEFIVNYAKTMEAVKRLASNDKVKYFANLIRNGYLSGERISNDEFEEYLDILNSMSYREIEYLVGYKMFCKNNQIENGKNLDEWQGYLCQYVYDMDVEPQMNLLYMLPKLIRTGFLEEVHETVEDHVNTENNKLQIDRLRVRRKKYQLTMSFDRFYELVLEHVE